MGTADVEPDGGSGDPAARSATPSSLLHRLRSADDEAWGRLLGLYGPTVEGWCRRAGLGAEDAADVGQEVFQAVAKGLADFRRDRPGDSFRGWLYAITRHRLLDHRRRDRRRAKAAGGTDAHRRLEELPEEEPADTAAAAGDRGAVYRRAVGLLRAEFAERTWQAFWGVAVDGRAAEAVAADLGMTPGAVYVAKSRVLKRLRAEFADLL